MAEKDPLWRKYEQAVRLLLAAMDPNAEVVHNAMIAGRLSGVLRQVDVLARGTVVGLEISVAAECKRYARAIGIGAVDQFVGKLLDLGAERGVLYSYSGFSAAAVRRAFGSSSPNVLLAALDGSEAVQAAPYDANYWARGPIDPLWADDLDTEEYLRFLQTGKWWKA
jgi:hypothetical protein